MRSRFAFGVLAVAITVALTSYLSTRVDASTGPIPLNCNRACLEGVVNDYLTALVARDPKRLPLSAELIGIADGYFSSVQKNDGKGINGTGTYPFTNDCHRIENGAPTTNVQPNPAGRGGAAPGGQAPPAAPAGQGRGARGGDAGAAPAPPAQPNINASAMDCLSQFKLGYYFVVQNIHSRRYPVVDQENFEIGRIQFRITVT